MVVKKMLSRGGPTLKNPPKKHFFIFTDFFGFHMMSQLDVTASTDIELPDMTLTTCLTICSATTDPTHVAIIQENRCVCAKGVI